MSSAFKDEFGNDLIPDIALPNEIPPMPNLNDLPAHVLHSGTVETLIGQNEDLFARLKVSFKTNAELERKIMIMEHSELEVKHINSSLLAQIQIYQEKDKAQKSKYEELEEKLSLALMALENERKNSSDTRLQLDEKGDAFQMMKAKLAEAAAHIESQEQTMKDLEVALKSHGEFQLQQAEKNYNKNLIELEQQVQAVMSENHRLITELEDTKQKAQQLKNISEKWTEAENKLIYFERRAEELESRYNKDVSDIQNQLTVYRTEAKSLSLQLHTVEQRLDEKLAENVRLKETLVESQDQFESLQTLWAEAQKRLEESRLKYDSLQKINQELSRKLKDQRTQAPTEIEVEAHNEKEEKFERLESLLAGIQAGFPRSVGMIEDSSEHNDPQV